MEEDGHLIKRQKHAEEVTANAEPCPTGDGMVSIYQQLVQLFTAAARTVAPNVTNPSIQIAVSKHADYQCNAAMALAKELKDNPRKISQKLVESLPSNPVVEKVEVSGPGFINITISKDFIRDQVEELVRKGARPPAVRRKRIVIDFSSPNVAKEMHVGHLRSTIIGDSICRLMEYLGHDVLRINHVGDWGTQFGMLIAHLKDEFPDFATKPPPVGDLQAFYKASKKRFDEDEAFKKRAYECVVKLQAREPNHFTAWQRICEVSRKEFAKIYDRLGIVIEERGESYYQTRMENLVKDLLSRGMLEEDEGRKIMFAPGIEIPLTMIKSDGGFTYDTSDMACIQQRIGEEKADRLIYVTDAGQATHFKCFLACADRAGIYKPSSVRVDHVTFGVVLGEDGKRLRTRAGETVRLVDLLDEGLKRSMECLKEKGRHDELSKDELDKAQYAVAYGCVKYADLSHDRVKDYVFSFDKMLDDKGNTAVYLLYALTRIRSIARKAGVTSEDLQAAAANPGCLCLEHEKEWKVARTLLKFPDVITKITDSLFLHPLCEYLYEVSGVFTEFYDACYCVEKDRQSGEVLKVHTHRLLLCEATAIIMQKCFDILGIKTLHKM